MKPPDEALPLGSPMLDVQGLQLLRKGFKLGPLDLQLHKGSRTAIVGASGAGKTTLLRCLAGFDTPTAGRVAIAGRSVHGDGRPLPPQQRGLGFVFQDGALWAHLTAVQHLQFVMPQWTRQQALELLAEVGLEALADRKPGSMSGGEAQRLGLARALATRPALLLLDEPLRSVDVHRRDELVALIRRLARQHELTTVLVTHDRDEALALAADLVVLDQGRIVEQGRANDLLAAPQTAFTATFLAGGTALPTEASAGGYATPFGVFADAGYNGHTRLVVLPGDVAAEAADTPGTVPARVVCMLPTAAGLMLKAELGAHVLTARTERSLQPGDAVGLRLLHAPRLLPWGPPEDQP